MGATGRGATSACRWSAHACDHMLAGWGLDARGGRQDGGWGGEGGTGAWGTVEPPRRQGRGDEGRREMQWTTQRRRRWDGLKHRGHGEHRATRRDGFFAALRMTRGAGGVW